MSSKPPYRISDWRAASLDFRRGIENSIPEEYRLSGALADRAARRDLKPNDPNLLQSDILTDLNKEITDVIDAPTLVSHIVNKKYSAVQVTEAYCKRAALAHQCTGCLTAFFPCIAMDRARELDQHLRRTGQPVGILHGLPLSVKDTFDITGQPTTAGLVSWLPNVAQSNSLVADAILAAGGILYAKTATSQACLLVESISNAFGVVCNPHNLGLSAGGSSGGEAALVAANGSILGAGSDGGGSIRFPCSFCGLWGLKSSKGRIPNAGCDGPKSGSESVNGAHGPMAKTVASLELWMQAQLSSAPWDFDSSCVPMPWNLEEAKRPAGRLTIAVLWDDGVVKPTPPITVRERHRERTGNC